LFTGPQWVEALATPSILAWSPVPTDRGPGPSSSGPMR
jgi:hypothetical protein